MAFEDLADDIENSENIREKVDATPKEVTQTIELAQRLLDFDYKNALLKTPYMEGMALRQHMNLFKLGWRIQFGTSRQWAGLCDATPNNFTGKSKVSKNIYISINFVKHDANWANKMQEVILHEISHAIVVEMWMDNWSMLRQRDPNHFELTGHGNAWQSVCTTLNNGECPRFYKDASFKDEFYGFYYECYSCDYVGYGKTPRFTTLCERCYEPVMIYQKKV